MSGDATMPPDQLDLLTWAPPQAELGFAERDVRAATLPARVSRAVATALREAKRPRREIAEAMSAYLGEHVSPAMVDAYASQARDTHRISVPRFMALVHATGDQRLLQLLAQPMGWAVVERRYVPLIAAAQIRQREDELRRQREALTRRAQAEGAL